jgi:predicted alpha/beta hydrolase
MSIERRRLTVAAPDGASAALQLHVPAQPWAWIHWLPALGVGIGPNETFADAMAARGVAVAIHEWRGLGSSDRRASRRCDWGYRELLDLDLPAGLAAAAREFEGVPGWIGGHSLGGQFALIEAARRGSGLEGVFLVASGQPHWRQFPGAKKYGVLAFAQSIPLLTAFAGHFPGARLGFAGREAGRLMREWSRSCVRGDYRIGDFGAQLDEALAAWSGRVLAIRLSQDRLAPPGAIERLRALAPRAAWDVRDFGAERFVQRRPDHFGWLREPGAMAEAFEAFAGRPAWAARAL